MFHLRRKKKQEEKPILVTCPDCGRSYDADAGKCPYCFMFGKEMTEEEHTDKFLEHGLEKLDKMHKNDTFEPFDDNADPMDVAMLENMVKKMKL